MAISVSFAENILAMEQDFHKVAQDVKEVMMITMERTIMSSLIFQNGIKNADFVVFNPHNLELTEEQPILKEIKLEVNEYWDKIKSLTLSSGCRFFFVLSDNQIVIGNTINDEAFLCKNLSLHVFAEFLNAFSKKPKEQ